MLTHSRIAVTIAGVAVACLAVRAGIIQNPSLAVRTIGAESDGFRWDALPAVQGSYDATGKEYTLTGNGQGVYWCWDGCGFAYVNQIPLTSNFTFTARIKSISSPTTGVGQIGIMVKGRLGTREPVLSLRWDTYWESQGSGLSWFNRITPTGSMTPMGNSYSEKQCWGEPQGCQGSGFENHLPGYAKRDDLWLRIKRVKEGEKSKYFLYAKYGADAQWNEIGTQTGAYDPCGGTPPASTTLPAFTVPEETVGGRVFAGLFVAHGTKGVSSVTATFDNITLEAENSDARVAVPSQEFAKDAAWWPCYSGPYTNYVAKESGYPLVDMPADAWQVWRSQEMTGAGRAPFGSNPQGGGASPVAADGMVFVTYYVPTSGTSANDAIVAMSAVDGHTLWKKSYSGGLNWRVLTGAREGKEGPCNISPCVFGGRLFVLGSGGIVYALEAATGKEIWKSGSLIGAGAALSAAQGSRSWRNPLAFARNVLLLPDQEGGLKGVNPDNGSQLWQVPGCIGADAAPARCTIGGKEYVIVGRAENQTVTCIDPSVGSPVWQLSSIGANSQTIVADQGYMLARIGGSIATNDHGTGGVLGCYAVTQSGAEQKWKTGFALRTETVPVIYKGHVYAMNDDSTMYCLELATGKVVSQTRSKGSTPWIAIADGRCYVELDGTHSNNEMYVLDADPLLLRRIGLATWVPPHAPASTYQVPMAKCFVDGRVFFRGADGVYCYDMRKPGPATAGQHRGSRRPSPQDGSWDPAGSANGSTRIVNLRGGLVSRSSGAFAPGAGIVLVYSEVTGRMSARPVVGRWLR